MRKGLTVALFICCMSFGYWINQHSWNGLVFVYMGEERAPAAVRTLGDFSGFDHSALYRRAELQLVEGSKVIREKDGIGIQLGHFFIRHPDGSREFACEIQDHVGAYDRIEMTLLGEGVSENGEPPKMIVTANCHAAKRLDRLAPIWIPMAEITSSKPNDKDWQTYGDHPVDIRLQAIPDQWPETWTLWSVRFYRSSNPDDSFIIGFDRLRQIQNKRVSFDWKPASVH